MRIRKSILHTHTHIGRYRDRDTDRYRDRYTDRCRYRLAIEGHNAQLGELYASYIRRIGDVCTAYRRALWSL